MEDTRLKSKENFLKENSYSISFLILFYFKKVFSIKNILMFIILFFLILTIYNSISKIITANALNLSDKSITLNTWTTIFLLLIFISLW